MNDPFTNGGGAIVSGAATAEIATIRRTAVRAIEAYRNNIATPDVHIADHKESYTPVVVGEDGETLTPERRKQLMLDAKAEPMFNPDGTLREGRDYTRVFEGVVIPEPFGRSAERNRPGYRVVQPRELELLEINIDDTTVRSAEGETNVPCLNNDPPT